MTLVTAAVLHTPSSSSNSAATGADRRTWPLGPLDRCIQLKHEQQGLTPAPPADPITRLRRLTLTLTGLPPTLDQLDEFEEANRADQAPDSWQRHVDRLLASPAHGERLASWWLDLARYADTHGYHADRHRDMWRWREWVIEAFNQNQPFDQFSIEQLAGDLLPSATLNQRLATGFLRNHMILYEDGAIDEEYRAEYVAERVATVGAVWLGQTLACARCHDHKYDRITQRDFYQLAAFFNNVPEKGIDGHYGNASPVLTVPTALQLEKEQGLLQELEATQRWLENRRRWPATKAAAAAARDAQEAWERRRQMRQPAALEPRRDWLFTWPDSTSGKQPAATIQGPVDQVAGRDGNVLLFTGETWVEAGDQADFDLDRPLSISVWVYPTTANSMTIVARQLSGTTGRGYDLSLQEQKLQWRMTAEPELDERIVVAAQPLTLRRWQHVTITQPASARAADVRFYVDARRVDVQIERDTLSRSIRNAAALEIGRRGEGDYWRGMLDAVNLYDRVLSDTEIAALAGSDAISRILALPWNRRTVEQSQTVRRLFLEESDPEFLQQSRRLGMLQSELSELRRSFPTAMVMQEQLQRRPTFVLRGGRYDAPLEEVQAELPGWIPRVPSEQASEKKRPASKPREHDAPGGSAVGPSTDKQPTRLDLAHWIMTRDHPLTARVLVSRIWQLHWGQGLTATPDDFGARGTASLFPELHDWLAREFTRDWDLKRLERTIVTSAAFQQASAQAVAAPVSRPLNPKSSDLDSPNDPENQWLTRGPRRRMTAEMVRDVALASSELLDRQIGGRSVFPWQPAGLWEELAFETEGPTAQVYRTSRGAGLVRRSLYSYWKRAALAPAMVAFDAPDREVCVLDRPPSTTPHQALVLMNEPTRWYAARELAEQALTTLSPIQPTLTQPESSRTIPVNRDGEVIDRMMRRVTSRVATARQRLTLLQLLEEQRQDFRQEPGAARTLLKLEVTPENSPVPDRPSESAGSGSLASDQDVDLGPIKITVPELAAWTSVAHVILSLPAAVELP
ncbi:MAG: DUF1549 domain-containing protein [Planctomycetota bacterium]